MTAMKGTTSMSSEPPSAPAYMLSLLRRRLAAGGALFELQYPGFWLVWEPGRWSAAMAQFDPTRQGSGETLAEGSASDSLSFHLKVRARLKLGRAGLCDIIINDATVSREHLLFAPSGETDWKVSVLSSASNTEVDGVARTAGDEVVLSSGAAIRVGDVKLTFWNAVGLSRRLRA